MADVLHDSLPPTIVGLRPDGIGPELGTEIGLKVRARVEELSPGVTVRSQRMVPSTVIRLDGGAIQFVAYVTVVPTERGPDTPPARSKVVDSVVTIDLGAARDKVKDVSVPFLELQPA